MKAAYRRLVVKLSGEQLAGDNGFGISPEVIAHMARELRDVHELGTQLSVVIGGGNVIRGLAASAAGMDRASADYMGMMASVINALALQDAMEKEGLLTRVLSALEIQSVAEAYIRRRAVRHMEKGRVVLAQGGDLCQQCALFGVGRENQRVRHDAGALSEARLAAHVRSAGRIVPCPHEHQFRPVIEHGELAA